MDSRNAILEYRHLHCFRAVAVFGATSAFLRLLTVKIAWRLSKPRLLGLYKRVVRVI